MQSCGESTLYVVFLHCFCVRLILIIRSLTNDIPVQLLNCENQFRRIRVRPKDVVLPGIFVILSNTIVLTLWQLISPLQYERIYDEEVSVDAFGRGNIAESGCVSSGNSEVYFLLALFSINGTAITGANFQAFRARRIATEFSESKYIGISMAILFQALLIALPVFLFSVNTEAGYLAKSALMLVVGASILYLIFIPKIKFWREYTILEREKALKRARRQNVHESYWQNCVREALPALPEHDCESSSLPYPGSGDLSVKPVEESSTKYEYEETGEEGESGMRVFVPPRRTSSSSFHGRDDAAARGGSGLRVVSHSVRGSSRSQSGNSSGIGSGAISDPNQQQPSRLPPIPDDSVTSSVSVDPSCSETKLDVLKACMESPDSSDEENDFGFFESVRLEL